MHSINIYHISLSSKIESEFVKLSITISIIFKFLFEVSSLIVLFFVDNNSTPKKFNGVSPNKKLFFINNFKSGNKYLPNL